MLIPENASSDTSATTLNGADMPGSQPDNGTSGDGGQPDNMQNAQPTEEPAGEGSEASQSPADGGKSIEEQLEFATSQYKKLQTEFNKRNEAEKELSTKFEKYGGSEQLLKLAENLTNNPEFNKWVQSQQQSVYGIPQDKIEPDQKEAIEMVEKIAQSVNEKALDNVMKTHIEPLVNKMRMDNAKKVFSEMDGKYPNWRDMQSEVRQLSNTLDQSLRENPSLKDVEGLYFRALAESGKMEEFAAVQHQKKLEEMKKNTSDAPPESVGTTGDTTADDILTAFENAKRSLGIQGEVRSVW